MPGGDGTGPMGSGSMTGRAAGRCAGFYAPGFANRELGSEGGPALGRGRGIWSRGFGGGRGWRNQYFATGLPGWARGGRFASGWAMRPPESKIDREAEKLLLARRAEALHEELERLEKRFSELEGRASTDQEP
jgi:hypothetical protein